MALDPGGRVINDLDLVAGPTPHRELAMKSGTALIKSKQKSPGARADTERFRNSEIPYRDW
jgi:hypothetical protein